jgi:uncharacterized protein (DUF952 family)
MHAGIHSHQTERTSEFRLATGTTLHICAHEHWIRQSHLNEYEPEQFAKDGFVHCTNDRSRLLEIANAYYQHDLRPYVAVEIDLDSLPVLAIYEDADNEFPHLYGRIPLSCVRRVIPIDREDDGAFVRLMEDARGTTHTGSSVD